MNKSLWQRLQPHAIAIGIFFVISCAYCLPAFKGMVVAQHDLTGWQGMAQQSIEYKEKFGNYPLWTQSTFSGMPAYQIIIGSSFDVHIAYLHHLFMMFLPAPAGLFFLACIGFYILCLTLGIRNNISMLASLAYGFASYNAVIVAVGHTTKFSSMGYAPAVLAGLILLSQRRYLLGFIVTLVFSTQLFYQNHVQIVYYTLLIALCIGVSHAVQELRAKQLVHLGKAGSLALIAGVMGMLSYAIVLFPTYDYTKETMRGGRSELTTPDQKDNKSKGGLDKDYAFGYSYGITEVLTIAVPRMYGGSSGEMPAGSRTAAVFAEKTGMGEEQADQYARSLPAYWGPQGGTSGAVYFGSLICVLFIFGLVFYTGKHSGWIIAATLLGILLAWGKHFETFNYFLFDHLPFYNKFRAPSMAMVIPQLTFPLLAALGLNQVLDDRIDKTAFHKKFKLASIVSAIFLAVLVLMYFALDYKGESDAVIRDQLTNSMTQQMGQQGTPSAEMVQQAQDFGRSVVNALKEDRRSMYGSDLVRSLIFIALGLGLLYGYSKYNLNRQFVVIGLTVLIFIDLIGIDLRYLNSDNYVDPDEFTDVFTPTPADLQVLQDTSYYRVFNSEGDPFQSSPATSRTSYLHNNVGGYHPAKLALYNDLIMRQLSRGNMEVFNMLNTKYFMMANPSDGKSVAQRNDAAHGPAWFVRSVRYVANADEEMSALDTFSAGDTAIADKREQAKITFSGTTDSAAAIQLVEHTNDRMLYRSSSGSDGFAVFSEIYYPSGWSAFIDGKESPIARVNYVLRGLSIPAGEHDIEFRFEPQSYTIGNLTSLVVGILSILVLLYGVFVLWKEKRHYTAAASSNQ